MKRHSVSQHRSNRRGAVLVLCVFVLMALLFVIALSLNLSWLQYKKLEAQSAADLGSLSAMNQFARERGVLNDPSTARLTGARVVALNEGNPLVELDRIRFGYLSNPNAHEPLFFEDETQVDAVEVTRSTNPTDVPIFMGSLVGQSTKSVSAEAVSTYPPLDIVLCLDASRSMTRYPNGNGGPGEFNAPPEPGSRWHKLTETVDQFLTQVANVNPYARIGLVTFGGGYLDADPPSPLDADFARTELNFQLADVSDAKQVMDSYLAHPRLGLGTYIYDAIEHSELLLKNHGNRRAVRAVILLSDGQQATQEPNKRPAPHLAVQWTKAKGIPIHTINFQDKPNPALDAVANETGGASLDAGNGPALEAAFNTILHILRTRLAR